MFTLVFVGFGRRWRFSGPWLLFHSSKLFRLFNNGLVGYRLVIRDYFSSYGSDCNGSCRFSHYGQGIIQRRVVFGSIACSINDIFAGFVLRWGWTIVLRFDLPLSVTETL